MISRVTLSVMAMAAGLFVAAMPASAATLPASALKAAADAQSPISQAHFWHRTCRKGLNGWHKHVKGVGRVQCTNHRCNRNGRCYWY